MFDHLALFNALSKVKNIYFQENHSVKRIKERKERQLYKDFLYSARSGTCDQGCQNEYKSGLPSAANFSTLYVQI